jgi:hypothetical protein
LRVLIVGGYGVFGGRLAGLLADEARLTLIIAGRSPSKAQAFCEALPPGAGREAAQFDRDGDLATQLSALKPDVVVDASGPFQVYGDEPYRLVQASIAAGAHYMDLADGADFVSGISAFDGQAKAAGVCVLSGVSSFPVLTTAVVRELAKGLGWIHAVVGGIAPSPYAGVGGNVIRGVSAYAGKPLMRRVNGKERPGFAWTESIAFTVAPPGRLPLKRRRFSLVDVPDLQVLPKLWPQLRTVWMGAAPAPAVLHLGLRGLAWLVRVKLLPSLTPLAPLFHWASNTIRWGEHRGGMFVRVTGYVKNRPVERSWHLLAEGEDGPLLPSMAAEALVRRMLEGAGPAPGARACVSELNLADYDRLFERRTIYTGRRERTEADVGRPLYRRALGEAYDRLPPALQAMHEVSGRKVAEGRATVERGRNPLGWLVAALFRFPSAGADVPVGVAFEAHGGAEYWRRLFDKRLMRSVQSEGQGRWSGLVIERFGVIRVGLALVLEGERLRLVVRRWTVLGVPLPLTLAPRGDTYEFEQDGRFNFHVEIASPLTGLIVRYKGWLKPRTS